MPSWRLKEHCVYCNHLRDASIDEVTKTANAWTGTEAYIENPYGFSVGDFNGASHLDITALLARFSSLTEVTISVLFKIDSLGADRVIFAASDSGDASSEIKFNVSSLNKVIFSARENGSGIFSATSTTTVIANHWYHAVGTVNSTASYIYLDGKYDAVGTGAAGFSVVNDLDHVAIGANKDSGGLQWYWNGGIGTIKIHNFVATYDEAIVLNRMAKRGL